MKKMFVFSLFLMVCGCGSKPVVEEAKLDLVAAENGLDPNQDNTSLIIKNISLYFLLF